MELLSLKHYFFLFDIIFASVSDPESTAFLAWDPNPLGSGEKNRIRDKHLGSVPDPLDPHVFGPSGFASQRYGSGSFYHAKKTLIPSIL